MRWRPSRSTTRYQRFAPVPPPSSSESTRAGPSSSSTPRSRAACRSCVTSPRVRTAYSRSSSKRGCARRFARSPEVVNRSRPLVLKSSRPMVSHWRRAPAAAGRRRSGGLPGRRGSRSRLRACDRAARAAVRAVRGAVSRPSRHTSIVRSDAGAEGGRGAVHASRAGADPVLHVATRAEAERCASTFCSVRRARGVAAHVRGALPPSDPAGAALLRAGGASATVWVARGALSRRGPPFEHGLRQRAAVHVLEFTADRQAARDAGDLRPRARSISRRSAPWLRLRRVKLVASTTSRTIPSGARCSRRSRWMSRGPTPSSGDSAAHQHEVQSAVALRLLHHQQVGRRFHHAQQRRIAPRASGTARRRPLR